MGEAIDHLLDRRIGLRCVCHAHGAPQLVEASRRLVAGGIRRHEPVFVHLYPARELLVALARSVAPEYAQDSLTPAFASHLDDLIPAAQLWLHGHTHDSFDYPVQTSNLPTRVVCNPRGYPRSAAGSTVAENASFDPALILEI